MIDQMKTRTVELQRRLRDEGVDLAVLTDEDSIGYYGGFWGYLGVEFGRPVWQHLDGPQLETDWLVIAGWRLAF